MTMPRAFFSVWVAVSSTIILRNMIMSWFMTLTAKIIRRIGTILSKLICSCIKISSVSQPIAFGVICARTAEAIIIISTKKKFSFCLKFSRLYNFFNVLFISKHLYDLLEYYSVCILSLVV